MVIILYYISKLFKCQPEINNFPLLLFKAIYYFLFYIYIRFILRVQRERRKRCPACGFILKPMQGRLRGVRAAPVL